MLAAPVSSPPLIEGDCLSSDEFLRRWEEMPDVKHAELIDGIVYMPSPVSLGHGKYQFMLNAWLAGYVAATPGCIGGAEATWLMGERSVPQPDLTLMILPDWGGQWKIEGDYGSGAPEMIVEVAVSSYSRDFGVKRRLYERIGVREYIIALPREERLVWLELTPAGFQDLQPGADAIFRSSCFPGLWLHPGALWDLDLPSTNAVLQQGLATPEHAAFVTHLASQKH